MTDTSLVQYGQICGVTIGTEWQSNKHIDQNVAGFVESVNTSFKLTPKYQCSIKNLVNLVLYLIQALCYPDPCGINPSQMKLKKRSCLKKIRH